MKTKKNTQELGILKENQLQVCNILLNLLYLNDYTLPETYPESDYTASDTKIPG